MRPVASLRVARGEVTHGIMLSVLAHKLFPAGDTIIKLLGGQLAGAGLAALLGAIVFGDVPDLLTMIGALMIVAAGMACWIARSRTSPVGDPEQAKNGRTSLAPQRVRRRR